MPQRSFSPLWRQRAKTSRGAATQTLIGAAPARPPCFSGRLGQPARHAVLRAAVLAVLISFRCSFGNSDQRYQSPLAVQSRAETGAIRGAPSVRMLAFRIVEEQDAEFRMVAGQRLAIRLAKLKLSKLCRFRFGSGPFERRSDPGIVPLHGNLS